MKFNQYYQMCDKIAIYEALTVCDFNIVSINYLYVYNITIV